MNPLLAILSSQPAASALASVQSAAAAVGRPFAEVLGALADRTEPAASIPASEEDEQREDRVAARLQEILEAAGVTTGDCATVCYDAVTDEVEVDGRHADGGDAAAAAIEADQQLMDDLRQMAEIDAADNEQLELLVQVA